jgi:flagellar hook-associated protein 1 FlgK
MSSTFTGVYVARSGIQNARANLRVTGQNITNVNSQGYTRQRVQSNAIPASGINMRYANGVPSVGEGVEFAGIDQIRNPFLDVRFREEHAKNGKADTMLNTLNDISNILDESTKDGINAQFNDLLTHLNNLASKPWDYNNENLVKTSSMILTKALNNASVQLENIRKQQTDTFKGCDIPKVNNLLKNIAHLNQEIKSSDISGNTALELVDQRNVMIDELSQYVNIEVSSKNVDIGAGRRVSEMSINLVSGDKKFNLIDHNQFNEFSLDKDVNLELKNSDGKSVTADDGKSTLTNSDITQGIFSGHLTMLNEKGEYDTTKGTERGIGYYQNVLDKFASEFAKVMNTSNSTNADGNNKPLFTTADGETTGITAGNISISDTWNKSTSSYITCSKNAGESGVDTSKQGDNIFYMISQLKQSNTYKTDDKNETGNTLFTTSLSSYISDVSVSVLALQTNDISRQNATFNATLNEIDTQRNSISSVDIDEEGINLIMFNKALTASSRFMTTLDEALDTIINKMGIIGR